MKVTFSQKRTISGANLLYLKLVMATYVSTIPLYFYTFFYMKEIIPINCNSQKVTIN